MHSRNIKKCTDLIKISDRYKAFANDNIDKQSDKKIYEDIWHICLRYYLFYKLSKSFIYSLPAFI